MSNAPRPSTEARELPSVEEQVRRSKEQNRSTFSKVGFGLFYGLASLAAAFTVVGVFVFLVNTFTTNTATIANPEVVERTVENNSQAARDNAATNRELLQQLSALNGGNKIPSPATTNVGTQPARASGPNPPLVAVPAPVSAPMPTPTAAPAPAVPVTAPAADPTEGRQATVVIETLAAHRGPYRDCRGVNIVLPGEDQGGEPDYSACPIRNQ